MSWFNGDLVMCFFGSCPINIQSDPPLDSSLNFTSTFAAAGGIGKECGRPPPLPPFISSAVQFAIVQPRNLGSTCFASNMRSSRIFTERPAALSGQRHAPQRADRPWIGVVFAVGEVPGCVREDQGPRRFLRRSAHDCARRWNTQTTKSGSTIRRGRPHQAGS